MKVMRILAVVLLVVSAVPVWAQGTDITLWASWVQLESHSFDDPEFDIDLDFESSVGFGASANWFWGDHFSTELGVMSLKADAELSTGFPEGPVVFPLGSIDITPIMLTAQYHFSPDSAFDPYLGVGVAHVMTGDLLDESDPDAVPAEFDDETGVLFNAGIGFSVTPNFGLTLDARYIPLEPTVTDELDEFEVTLNPLIVSAGLRWRFGGF
jgi:outer membrane protein W